MALELITGTPLHLRVGDLSQDITLEQLSLGADATNDAIFAAVANHLDRDLALLRQDHELAREGAGVIIRPVAYYA